MSAVRVLRALQSSKSSEAQTKARRVHRPSRRVEHKMLYTTVKFKSRSHDGGTLITVGRPLQKQNPMAYQNPDIKKEIALGVLPWRRGWVSGWRYNVGDLAVLDTCVTLDTVLTRVHLDTHECERHERWSPSRPRAGRKAWGESAAL